ncbi:MarR family winged helix-turn-helix transcriptional regulator [Xanthobacter sp. DSM 24535]|uniref:MarR family winged helix-turn-helix transcriptional regulator n=1 Tax=Roseixanthobacter psychrophilus TaxID=3119917 RepID=UPI003728304A
MTILDLERFIPYRLNRAAAAVSERLKEVYGRKHSLTIPEWRVLATVAQFPGVTAKTVGTHARLHKTKVSRAVDALQERRWLARTENPEDRREDFLSLTAQGWRSYRTLIPDMAAFESKLCVDLGPEGTQVLLDALDRLERALRLGPRN